MNIQSIKSSFARNRSERETKKNFMCDDVGVGEAPENDTTMFVHDCFSSFRRKRTVNFVYIFHVIEDDDDGNELVISASVNMRGNGKI
jgi:hypothetical protein